MKPNAILLAVALLIVAGPPSSAADAEPVAAATAAEAAPPDDVAAAAALARERGLPLLLHFTADWCGYCRLMERQVFSRDAWKSWAATGVVVAAVALPASADDPVPDSVRDLAVRYGIEGVPTYVLLSTNGVELARWSWRGVETPEAFARKIRTVLVESDPAALAAALSPEEAEEFARLKARVAAIESGDAVEGRAELEARIEAWQKRLDEAKANAPDTVRALQSEAVAELTPLQRDVNAKRRALAAEYARAVERLEALRAKLAK